MKTARLSAFFSLALFIASAARGQTLEWARQLDTGASRAASADRFGNVYISGVEGYLAKYDASGELQWTQVPADSEGLGVSADGLGSVYIAGGTGGSLGGPNAGRGDAFIRKYDASGQLQWTGQLGSSEDESARGVSADGLGSVYIAGFTNGNLAGASAGFSDAFLSKYDAADGQLQWTRQLGSSEGDNARAVSADGLGSVYIAGMTDGSLAGTNAGGRDAFLSKYDAADGELQWTRQFGTSSNEFPILRGINTTAFTGGVSADGLGNVYVSGPTEGSLGGPNAGGVDTFIRKYDWSGQLQWTRQLGTAWDDLANGISADGLGNVYISGWTDGSLGAPHAGNGDVFLAKYDAGGELQWTRQFGSDEHDSSRAITTDWLGNVYITGDTYGSLDGPNAGSRDVFISKYDADGELQWLQQFGTSSDDSGRGVSAATRGRVYVSGHTEGSLGGANAGGREAFLFKFRTGVTDFDRDGDLDADDTDLLVAEIVAGTNNLAFDLTGDGLVAISDRDQWLNDAANANGFAAPYQLGDANLDGVVDAIDLNNLGQNWLTSPNAWQSGDFTADGIVDAADLNQLGQNWQSASPVPGAVPLRADSVSYVQDFDAMGVLGRRIGTEFPSSWSVIVNGTRVDTVLLGFPISSFVPESGTPTFNAGSISDTDRTLAIGVRENPDELIIELLAQNTGVPADSFQLEFDIEAWDAADGNVFFPSADNPGEAAFKVTVDIDSGDGFTSLVDLGTVTTGPILDPVEDSIVDGNADANRISFDSDIVSAAIPTGSLLRLRWAPDLDARTRGWVFGIDNVSLRLFAGGAVAAVPEPATATLILFGLTALMWRRRR